MNERSTDVGAFHALCSRNYQLLFVHHSCVLCTFVSLSPSPSLSLSSPTHPPIFSQPHLSLLLFSPDILGFLVLWWYKQLTVIVRFITVILMYTLYTMIIFITLVSSPAVSVDAAQAVSRTICKVNWKNKSCLTSNNQKHHQCITRQKLHCTVNECCRVSLIDPGFNGSKGQWIQGVINPQCRKQTSLMDPKINPKFNPSKLGSNEPWIYQPLDSSNLGSIDIDPTLLHVQARLKILWIITPMTAATAWKKTCLSPSLSVKGVSISL